MVTETEYGRRQRLVGESEEKWIKALHKWGDTGPDSIAAAVRKDYEEKFHSTPEQDGLNLEVDYYGSTSKEVEIKMSKGENEITTFWPDPSEEEVDTTEPMFVELVDRIARKQHVPTDVAREIAVNEWLAGSIEGDEPGSNFYDPTDRFWAGVAELRRQAV